MIDSDFEQRYIDKETDLTAKQALQVWRLDGREYYQQLSGNSVKGNYIPLSSQQHIVPFADPDLLVRLIERARVD